MANPVSSKPWHAVFAFLIAVAAMVVQMHFPNSSPADKHSPNVWIFMACLFLYGFSSTYYESHASISNNDAPFFKLSSHISTILGSMACTVLISVLASKPVLALIITIYLTWLLICKKMGSYVYDMCKGIERHHGPRDNQDV